jgi:DNA-binding protein
VLVSCVSLTVRLSEAVDVCVIASLCRNVEIPKIDLRHIHICSASSVNTPNLRYFYVSTVCMCMSICMYKRSHEREHVSTMVHGTSGGFLEILVGKSEGRRVRNSSSILILS